MRKCRGKRLLALSCLSLRPSIRILVAFSEMCLEAPDLVEIGHKYQPLYMKTSVTLRYFQQCQIIFSCAAVQREPKVCVLWHHGTILYSCQLRVSQQEYKANIILLLHGKNVRRTRHNCIFYYIAYLFFI